MNVFDKNLDAFAENVWNSLVLQGPPNNILLPYSATNGSKTVVFLSRLKYKYRLPLQQYWEEN